MKYKVQQSGYRQKCYNKVPNPVLPTLHVNSCNPYHKISTIRNITFSQMPREVSYRLKVTKLLRDPWTQHAWLQSALHYHPINCSLETTQQHLLLECNSKGIREYASRITVMFNFGESGNQETHKYPQWPWTTRETADWN